jgi:DNA-binding XRE family transcriptional regulator
MVDWSQEQLATAAEVALTSVRDLENEKRASDTGTATAVRHVLTHKEYDEEGWKRRELEWSKRKQQEQQ